MNPSLTDVVFVLSLYLLQNIVPQSYPSDDTGREDRDTPSSEENELLSLHLPGSVKEMKALIVQRKKKDSRIDNKFDLWQKHSIIQAL